MCRDQEKDVYHIIRLPRSRVQNTHNNGGGEEGGKLRDHTGGNVLRPAAGLGGELAVVDPRRALSPEKVEHLEKLAQFMYTKIGPAKDRMRTVTLLLVTLPRWERWKSAQKQANWNNAQLQQPEGVPMTCRDIEEPPSEAHIVLIKYKGTLDELRRLAAEECSLQQGTVQLQYRDHQGTLFSISSSHGFEAAITDCDQRGAAVTFYCTGRECRLPQSDDFLSIRHFYALCVSCVMYMWNKAGT